jgi:hypothetical protein
MRWLLTILLTVYPLICAGQEAKSPKIQPSDVLRISVWKEPDISRLVTVRPDGFIAMPLVNEIKVAGLTVQQVQTLVAERLQHWLANPEVTVSIQQRGTFLSALKGIELSIRQSSSPPVRPRSQRRDPCLCETLSSICR